MLEKCNININIKTFKTAAFVAMIMLAVPIHAQQLRQTDILTSNNIAALSGNGDTVWLATERGFNYRTSASTQSGWAGFEFNDSRYIFSELVFGGGGAIALVRDVTNNSPYSIGFWHFDHATGKQQSSYHTLSRDAYINEEEVWESSPCSVTFSNGYFWAKFKNNWLIKYDYGNNSIHAEITNEVSEDVFAPCDPTKSHAVNDVFYHLKSDNSVTVERKTEHGAAETDIIMPSDNFRLMLASAGGDPNPKIRDILFLPHTDSTGILAVATETGIYISEPVNPLTGGHTDYNFTLSRYVREVKAGQAYALPGIIRVSDDGRYDRSVFVYKLKKDGDVTIRVYDYNMSLVKTVVKGARRNSKAERSVDPSNDYWDGTNEANRRMSPGVYYFKITSTGGDRFFGKIILAK